MNLNAQICSDEKNLTLYTSDSPFSLPLRIDSFHSEKDFEHFIKTVEKLIHTSVEYRFWISFITETLGNRYCSLTNESIAECNVVVHHHPINLFTICKAITTDYISKNQKFCSFDVATKVIELHFQNKVGYMPILSDFHDKFHNGFQDLPIEFVHGDYKYLLENLPVDDNDREQINSLCSVHIDNCKVKWKKGDYPGIEEYKKAANE